MKASMKPNKNITTLHGIKMETALITRVSQKMSKRKRGKEGKVKRRVDDH